VDPQPITLSGDEGKAYTQQLRHVESHDLAALSARFAAAI
jgi:hypothetical protein